MMNYFLNSNQRFQRFVQMTVEALYKKLSIESAYRKILEGIRHKHKINAFSFFFIFDVQNIKSKTVFSWIALDRKLSGLNLHTLHQNILNQRKTIKTIEPFISQ